VEYLRSQLLNPKGIVDGADNTGHLTDQHRLSSHFSSVSYSIYVSRSLIIKADGAGALKYRGVRSDMIELYKIITCKQDNAVTLKFNTIPAPVTRGNTYKKGKTM